MTAECERFFETLAQAVPVGVYRLDDGICTYVNARFCELTGLSRTAALAGGWEAAVHPEDAGRTREQWALAARAGEPFASLYRLRRPDDTVVWVYGEARSCAGPDGKSCRVGTLSDMTGRRRVEEELRRNRDRLEATLQAMPDQLFEVDAGGVYLDARSRQPELLLAPAEKFLGRRVREMLPADASAAFHDALGEAAVNGQSFGRTFLLALPQGKRRFELSAARKPRQAPGGGPTYVFLSRDVTDRAN